MAPCSNHRRLDGAASLANPVRITLHIDVRGRLAVGQLLRGLVGLGPSSASHSISRLPVVTALPLQLEKSVTLQNVSLVGFAVLFEKVVA